MTSRLLDPNLKPEDVLPPREARTLASAGNGAMEVLCREIGADGMVRMRARRADTEFSVLIGSGEMPTGCRHGCAREVVDVGSTEGVLVRPCPNSSVGRLTWGDEDRWVMLTASLGTEGFADLAGTVDEAIGDREPAGA
jgi:hypothetical protein